ncbi:hypothetical protein EVAR_50238_1, partial [Eumeta japonica]
MLFSDIDSGLYRNGRPYLTLVNDYRQRSRPYSRESCRCLCHVLSPLKDYC